MLFVALQETCKRYANTCKDLCLRGIQLKNQREIPRTTSECIARKQAAQSEYGKWKMQQAQLHSQNKRKNKIQCTLKSLQILSKSVPRDSSRAQKHWNTTGGAKKLNFGGRSSHHGAHKRFNLDAKRHQDDPKF